MRSLFQQAAIIPFAVVGNVTQNGTYTIKEDDGFGTATSTDYPCKIVIDAGAKKAVFGDLIEIGDSTGYVAALNCSVPIIASNYITNANGAQFSIEKAVVDAAGAAYELLLRPIT